MADFIKKKLNENQSDDSTHSEEGFVTEKKQPSNTPTTSQSYTSKNKKKLKIIMIAGSYCVVNNAGNGQFVSGDFNGKKIGDEIEVEV